MPNPRTAEHQDRFGTANDQTMVVVGRESLPLVCPNPQTALWASHPRIFLPIAEAEGGKIRCPYCGTDYRLEG
jgi:uncharacterized Zn-finger protein